MVSLVGIVSINKNKKDTIGTINVCCKNIVKSNRDNIYYYYRYKPMAIKPL